MKKLMSLMLVLILSLGTCLGVYAQQPITENQESFNKDEQIEMKIVSYLLNLSLESRKKLLENPEEFVRNDKKLNELVSSLSDEDRIEFYSAIQDNSEEVQFDKVNNIVTERENSYERVSLRRGSKLTWLE